ncbi:MAG: hypothetical protein KGO82_20620, partial [Bacteroidota bacterium]|nr:hypothetical protein [Bacteroidota bacterium]
MRTRNFLIALLLLLFNFGAIAADPPLDVKLLWEGPYTISVKKDSDTLRIPVTISTSGVGAADLVVLLRPDDPLSGKLSGRFESDSLKTNWLVLSIAHIEEIRPDSYTSFILVSRKQTELRQTLKLTIVVKAAAVTVTPGLSLTYTRTLWGKDELKGPPLVLSENSGESRLGKFRIIGKQQSADGAPGTSLEFMPASESVEPLGTDTIHLNIANRPALGSSSGKFDVMAARLGTPLTFQVDLVTRLSGVYLVIFLLIGLACGLFFRIWLNYDIELSKARLAATEILTRILDEIKKRNDPVFIASAYSIYRDLDKAKEKTKAVEITAESVTAESALTAAVNDFNTRSTAVKSKLTEIENLLWGSWLLPATFSPAIEEKQNEFEEAKLKYESGNMVLASQATVNLDRLIAKDFFEIAFNYRSQTNVSISAIEQARLAIPDL